MELRSTILLATRVRCSRGDLYAYSCCGEAVAATMACWWARLALRNPWQLSGSAGQIHHLTFCETWPRCIGELDY